MNSYENQICLNIIQNEHKIKLISGVDIVYRDFSDPHSFETWMFKIN